MEEGALGRESMTQSVRREIQRDRVRARGAASLGIWMAVPAMGGREKSGAREGPESGRAGEAQGARGRSRCWEAEDGREVPCRERPAHSVQGGRAASETVCSGGGPSQYSALRARAVACYAHPTTVCSRAQSLSVWEAAPRYAHRNLRSAAHQGQGHVTEEVWGMTWGLPANLSSRRGLCHVMVLHVNQ